MEIVYFILSLVGFVMFCAYLVIRIVDWSADKKIFSNFEKQINKKLSNKRVFIKDEVFIFSNGKRFAFISNRYFTKAADRIMESEKYFISLIVGRYSRMLLKRYPDIYK